MKVDYGKDCDFESWIALVELVRECFPLLNLEMYKKALHQSILEQETLIAKDDKGNLVGVLMFSMEGEEIIFLAVHPEYRNKGIATSLIQHVFDLFPRGTNLKLITYRDDDVKGVDALKLYKSLGFMEGKVFTLLDYPCQELIYIVK